MDPARSFDRAAEEYDRGRPGWPEAVLDVVPVQAEATILDLAAGSGKLTEVLARRYARIVAVEPLPGMRALLMRRAPTAEVLDGRAEAIPLADASVNAVFVAQAFHWFANDAAIAEIARVLRDNGVAVLLWNAPSAGVPSPLPEPYRRRLRELKAAPEPRRDTRFQLERDPFGRLETITVEHEQVCDREQVLAYAASVSDIANCPDPERKGILGELGSLLPEGTYRLPWTAEVSWARRGPRR